MIKKAIFILFISFLMISCTKKSKDYLSGGYYEKVYLADSLFITGNHEKSYQLLDDLFSEFDPIDMSIYGEVLTYIKLKVYLNKNLSYESYTSLVSRYGYPVKLLKRDTVLQAYYNTVKERFDAEGEIFRKEYIASLNLDLREKILGMKTKDQSYRSSSGVDDEKQDKIDDINAKELINIFDTYGFPSEKIIGKWNVGNFPVDITAVLLHTEDSIRKKYFIPKVLDFVRKGQAKPRYVGVMFDQLLIYNGEIQYYGTYDSSPIEVDIEEINKRRKTIGLPNYKYEDWRYKTLYPEEYLEDQLLK